MKASDFDRHFDKGKDVSEQLDLKRARRPGWEQQRVNVDFPLWMVQSIDREAQCLGVTRQAPIKLWLADKLGQPRRQAPSPQHSGKHRECGKYPD